MFRHVPGCSMFRVLSTAVSDVVLTGRQSGQKLQRLYGNPMAKNLILRNL